MRDTTDLTVQCAAWTKMARAGLLPFVREVSKYSQEDGAPCLRGLMNPAVIARLEHDPRFAPDPWPTLHGDVGDDPVSFRSYTNKKDAIDDTGGSLQLVVDRQTGHFYADVDATNPVQDIVGTFGHWFGAVIPDLLRRPFRRRRRE